MTWLTLGLHATAAWLVAASGPLGAPTFVEVEGRAEQQVARAIPAVDETVRALMDEQELVGLAVGVVRSGRTELLKGYGYADLETRKPVDAYRTMFRWASISKPLTAIVASKLLRAGLIGLDDRVSKWWPEYRTPSQYLAKCKKGRKTVKVKGDELECEDGFADAKVPSKQRRITLRQLLTHTSGLIGFKSPRGRVMPRSTWLNDPDTNAGLAWGLKRLRTKPLMALPGAEYIYSTFGYNLAAVAMQAAAGKAWPDLVEEHIADPVGLATLQPDYEWVDISERATGYRIKKRGKDRVVPEKSYDVSWKMAGGGYISTPADLARFCGALMGDELLTDAAKALLWTEQATSDGEPTGYGIGFSVSTTEDGRRVVEHAGVQTKTRTRMRLYPDEDLCIVVMSNTATCKTKALTDAIDRALAAAAKKPGQHAAR